MTPQAALERGLAELEIALPAGAQEKLVQYTALLSKWNRTYNLTAIRDPLLMVSHHLLDSLAVLPHLPLPQSATSLADAGSGAGLPGIPLALARPQWRVTLAEANQKKAAFLRQAAIELKLANVEVYEGRVETWRPAEAFALVISRAFSALSDFLASCRHLVAPGGVLAAMKGAHPGDAQGGQVIRLRVPLLDAERHLVLCKV
jgi:16S rRNA (guanine527-N7)-methyltransferase